MATTIDVRGLSCPQPVLLTLEGIRGSSETEIQVLVDTGTSKENVIRAGLGAGCRCTAVVEEIGGYRITLAKG